MRFEFGRNWRQFLDTLSSARIQTAMDSLLRILDVENLEGRRFLDAGCGSGLFSLAALRLGANQVISFDYDSECVQCARLLYREFGPYANWGIVQGSVLDREWIMALGKFDIVYSWGVLHHTGSMWTAMDNVCAVVEQDGILCISIYNDQGPISRMWALVKKLYNSCPRWIRNLMVYGYLIPASLWLAVKGLLQRKALRSWFPLLNERGMHYYYDAVDWLGGYPFETAKPDEVIGFFSQREFVLVSIHAKSGSGCNEFVFRRL